MPECIYKYDRYIDNQTSLLGRKFVSFFRILEENVLGFDIETKD